MVILMTMGYGVKKAVPSAIKFLYATPRWTDQGQGRFSYKQAIGAWVWWLLAVTVFEEMEVKPMSIINVNAISNATHKRAGLTIFKLVSVETNTHAPALVLCHLNGVIAISCDNILTVIFSRINRIILSKPKNSNSNI